MGGTGAARDGLPREGHWAEGLLQAKLVLDLLLGRANAERVYPRWGCRSPLLEGLSFLLLLLLLLLLLESLWLSWWGDVHLRELSPDTTLPCSGGTPHA